MVRWETETQILDYSGDLISTIRCSLNEQLFLFAVDYMVLVYLNCGNVVFQVRHKLEQISHEFAGDFVFSAVDTAGLNIYLLCRLVIYKKFLFFLA